MRTKTGTKKTMGRTMENNGTKSGTMRNNEWNNGNNVWDNRTVDGTMENNESKG